MKETVFNIFLIDSGEYPGIIKVFGIKAYVLDGEDSVKYDFLKEKY